MIEEMKKESSTCSMCKKLVPKLVPMQDNDQKHKKQMACWKCKKKVRKGEKIEVFKGQRIEN